MRSLSTVFLSFAPIPALLGSLLILQAAAAPRSLLVQQAVVAAVGIAAALLYSRYAKPAASAKATPWILFGAAALVWVPLLVDASAPPHRWIGIAGLRLYIAPVVLPLFLLLSYRTLADSRAKAIQGITATALLGPGLLAQPDAAQLTAFAVGSIPVLAFAQHLRIAGLLTLAGLAVAAAVSWSQPDPLVPVPYVEGVFAVAANHSTWALLAALLSAALPLVALGWLALRTGSLGLGAVMLYFATLYLLAPLQVTPVPLLGFGAGPIIGYLLMAGHAGRSIVNAA